MKTNLINKKYIQPGDVLTDGHIEFTVIELDEFVFRAMLTEANFLQTSIRVFSTSTADEYTFKIPDSLLELAIDDFKLPEKSDVDKLKAMHMLPHKAFWYMEGGYIKSSDAEQTAYVMPVLTFAWPEERERLIVDDELYFYMLEGDLEAASTDPVEIIRQQLDDDWLMVAYYQEILQAKLAHIKELNQLLLAAKKETNKETNKEVT